MPVVTEGLVATLRAAGCVYAEDEAQVLTDAAADDDQLEQLVAARVAGTPLEQVVGWAGFRGLRLRVAPGVFVPRARSGLLVDLALPLLRPGALVVDLCCGTGALGAAVRAEGPALELHAADCDPVAVAVARANLPAAAVHEGDLLDALPRALRHRVDLIVCNAPYVPTAGIATMPPEARDHEHRVALDGGPDGLDVHRRLAAAAADWLWDDGHVVVETGRAQAPATRALFEEQGMAARIEVDDEIDGTAVVASLRRDPGSRRSPR